MTSSPPVTPLTTRQIAWRLFFTTWLVYSLHFTTDVVREHYPVMALGDRLSFNLEGYCGLHPDLFELPGKGCHIGNNPGVSMLAAIPYVIARPVIDQLVKRVEARRVASGDTIPPAYNTPWPNSRRFFAEAYRRGLDIKFGLTALVTQVFCMAPSSALGVVAMFFTLLAVLKDERKALWFSLIYAFATPVFYRTGFLNHNLMLGHITFAAFATLWNPWGGDRIQDQHREFLLGLAGGTAILFDYTGVVFIVGLGLYAVIKRWREQSTRAAVRAAVWYALGTLGPVLLLWLYQYEAFGNPFLPGQHWMPHVEWIERGYQGFEFPPVPELLGKLLFDIRFGLFVTMPVALLAIAAPLLNRKDRRVPPLELWTIVLLCIATWLFFGCVNYVRLQFNTGIRYLACLFPFLFLAASLVLARLRPAAVFAWALLGLAIVWPMAMYRKVQFPIGVLDPMIRTFTGGFTLPVLRTLSEMSGAYGDYFSNGVSALPFYATAGAIIWALWSPRLRQGGGPLSVDAHPEPRGDR